MSAELESQCEAAITAQLLKLSAPLTSSLRSIMGEPHPPTTYLFWFEYDSPDFANSFPVMFCRMNRSGHADEVRQLLPDASFTVSPEIVDDPRYEEADINTWALASTLFVPWFADCWEAAGGHRLPWPRDGARV
jgi:hypothetical protein